MWGLLIPFIGTTAGAACVFLLKDALNAVSYTHLCKIAWDISGDRDESKCIDIDPFNVFHSPVVDEFPEDETEIK